MYVRACVQLPRTADGLVAVARCKDDHQIFQQFIVVQALKHRYLNSPTLCFEAIHPPRSLAARHNTRDFSYGEFSQEYFTTPKLRNTNNGGPNPHRLVLRYAIPPGIEEGALLVEAHPTTRLEAVSLHARTVLNRVLAAPSTRCGLRLVASQVYLHKQSAPRKTDQGTREKEVTHFHVTKKRKRNDI